MKQFCVRICVLTLVFFVAPPLFLHADRVILKDGNVFEGDVVRRTDKEVTIRGKFGLITFSLRQVKKVREDGAIWIPNEAARTSKNDEADDKLEFTTPVVHNPWLRDQRLKELKESLLIALQEIDTNPLDHWERQKEELVVGPIGGAFRFEAADGSYEFSEGLPREQRHFQSAWICERNESEETPGGKPVHYWIPLYWNKTTNGWFRSPPNFSFFRWEQAQVEKMLDNVVDVVDPDLPVRVVMLLDAALYADSAETGRRKLRELRSLTKRIAEPWDGGGLLYEVYLTNLKIATAKSSKKKVDLARSRRKLLTDLIARLPGNATLPVDPIDAVGATTTPVETPSGGLGKTPAEIPTNPEPELGN